MEKEGHFIRMSGNSDQLLFFLVKDAVVEMSDFELQVFDQTSINNFVAFKLPFHERNPP